MSNGGHRRVKEHALLFQEVVVEWVSCCSLKKVETSLMVQVVEEEK